MRIAGRAAKGTLGLLLTLGFGLAPAAAQNLDLDEVGAALALPIVTGPDTATEIVVTNAGNATRLHLVVLSGDAEDRWQAQNFDCEVTRNETTLFVFSSDGAGGSLLTYECLDDNGDSTLFEDVPLAAATGIFFVSLEDPVSGQTVNTNQIFGDAAVIDFGVGTAYSVGAIPFQGKSITAGVADRKYRFDNVEYSAFPSKLATNFLAPREDAEAVVDAELILFTLDGSTGSPPPPPAQVSIKFYNDDEKVHSAGHAFDCFDIVALTQIDPRFAEPALGSEAGHLVLTPQTVTYPNLAHDATFSGAGNVLGVRKPPVHGWLVQATNAFTDVPVPVFDQVNAGPPTNGILSRDNDLAQSFTPSLDSLDFVDLAAQSRTPTLQQVRVDIRSGGVTGPVIGMSEMLTLPLVGLGELTRFPFPMPVALIPGSTFVIDLVHVSGGAGGWGATDDSYPGGTGFVNNNEAIIEDFIFRTGRFEIVAANQAAWARPLAQSQTGIVPSTGDTPVFFAP